MIFTKELIKQGFPVPSTRKKSQLKSTAHSERLFFKILGYIFFWKQCSSGFFFIFRPWLHWNMWVASDVIWNKFHATHWLKENKEGKSSNGMHKTHRGINRIEL